MQSPENVPANTNTVANTDPHYNHLRMMERDLRGLVDLIQALTRVQDTVGYGESLQQGIDAATDNLKTLAAAYADVTNELLEEDEGALLRAASV